MVVKLIPLALAGSSLAQAYRVKQLSVAEQNGVLSTMQRGITNPLVMTKLVLNGTGSDFNPKYVTTTDGVVSEDEDSAKKLLDDALHIDNDEDATCVNLKRGDQLLFPLPNDMHVKYVNVFGRKENDNGSALNTAGSTNENYEYKYFGLTVSIVKADGTEQSCYGPIETAPSKKHQAHHVMMLQERCYMSTVKTGAHLKLSITGQPFKSPMTICEVMGWGVPQMKDGDNFLLEESMSKKTDSKAVINPLIMDNLTPGPSGVTVSSSSIDGGKTVDDHLHKYSGNGTAASQGDGNDDWSQTCTSLAADEELRYTIGENFHVKFVEIFGHYVVNYKGLEVAMRPAANVNDNNNTDTSGDISCYGPIGYKNGQALENYDGVSQKHLLVKLSERCYMMKTGANTQYVIKNNGDDEFKICETITWGVPESYHSGGTL